MLHKDAVIADIHIIHQWTAANKAARLALSVVASDIGKICYQTDTNTWYVLANNSPMLWIAIVTSQTNMLDFRQEDSTTIGLTYGYHGGNFVNDNVVTTIADGTVALTDATTNYVEITSGGAVSVNLIGFTSGNWPMAIIVTAGGVITTVTDKRAFAGIGGSGGGSGGSTSIGLLVAIGNVPIFN